MDLRTHRAAGRKGSTTSQSAPTQATPLALGALALALAAAFAAGGCSGADDQNATASASALVNAEACTDAKLSWPDPASSSEKCSGPWQYYTSTSTPQTCWSLAPNIACPGSSYPTGKACNHEHVAKGTINITVPIVPIVVEETVCCEPAEGFTCPKPPCEVVELLDYVTPCAQAAAAEKDKFPAANLNLRSPITVGYAVNYATSQCNITLGNAPKSWHFAVDNTRCAASTVSAPDLERPVLASCAMAQKTVCGPSAADSNILSCSQVPNTVRDFLAFCASALQTSNPNLSLAQLRAAVGSTLVEDPAYRPVCLTDENQPLAGTDPTRLAQEKFARLQSRMWNLAGKAKDPALDAKLVASMKLLFELKGDLLTPNQRRSALDFHADFPDVEPSCGSTWDAPPEPPGGTGSLPFFTGFEGAGFSSWGINPAGSVIAVTGASTPPYEGTYSAQLGSTSPTNGDSTLWTTQTIPAAGGSLQFRYKVACTGGVATDWFTATVKDLVTNLTYVVVPPTCTNTGTWQLVNWNLASVAGHRITLSIVSHDNNAAGSAARAYVDAISFPTYPKERDGYLQFAHRLAEPHVRAEVTNAQIAGYASSAQFVAEYTIPNATAWPSGHPSRPAALKKASEAPVSVLQKAFAALAGADASARKPALQRNLWTLGLWFASAKDRGAYATEQFLSDLPYSEPLATWTPALRDRSTANTPLTLAGRQYGKGFGAHTESELVFNLAGKGCRTFFADVGVDDEVGNSCPGSAAGFEVHADGARIFSSGPKTVGQQPTSVSLDVTGKTSLKLKATLSDGANYCDHADWAWARVACDSAGDQERLWKDASDLVGVVWKSLDGPAYEAFRTSGNIGTYRDASLAGSREMLDALLSDYLPPGRTAAPPLVRAPALFVLADAWAATLERLDTIAPLHDLACRFIDCAGTARRSELSSLFRLTGALADPGALPSDARSLLGELTTADAGYSAQPANFSANWLTYRSLFDRIRQRHASVIQAAVKDATGSGTYSRALVLDIDDKASPPLVAFSAMVQGAGKRAENYVKSGLLLRDGAKALPTGLLASKIAAIDNAVAAAQAQLSQAIVDYGAAQPRYVVDLMDEIDRGVQSNDLTQRAADLAQRIDNLLLDDAGLKIAAAVDLSRFGDQNARLQPVLAALRDQGVSYVTEQSMAPLSLNGRDGRFTGSANDVRSLAVARAGPGGVYASVQAGHVLNVNVAGAYQPSCALQALGGKFYGQPVQPGGGAASLADAETGSPGYAFDFSTGSAKTHSVTNSKSETWSRRAEACYGGSVSVTVPPISVGLGSAQACIGYAWSKTWTSADTRGDEARSSAGFALGLRLPNTPFPNYPAGALLAVSMQPGQFTPANILDVQVVQQPQGTLVFGRAADVYLVVNDRSCATSGTAKSLSVTATKLVPTATKMLQIAAAMGAVESYLRDPNGGLPSQADAIVAQGRLLPGDVSRLKGDAWQKLRTQCGNCDLAGFPEVARGFFETWLDWQIAHIEREIEHVSIVRELDARLLEVQALERDLSYLGVKGRLGSLLPRWSLANLDYANANLELAVGHMVRMAAEELHPMVYLRYPEAMTGLVQVPKLLGLDWVREPLGDVNSPATMAGKVALATNEIKNKLVFAVLNSVDNTTAYAVLRFPNPWDPPVLQPGELAPPGREADVARATRVWGAIRNALITGTPEPIKFEIRPSDLFQSGVVNGLLGCSLVSPVVKDMALYLVTRAPDAYVYGSQDVRTDTRLARSMQFPLQQGVELWDFENEDYLTTPRSKVLYGLASEWLTRFGALTPTDLGESVRGTSPFTTYTVASLGAYGDPWWALGPDHTQDLMVVMRVEARQKAPGVSGIVTCP